MREVTTYQIASALPEDKESLAGSAEFAEENRIQKAILATFLCVLSDLSGRKNGFSSTRNARIDSEIASSD
jgi:hypothetical protein